MNCLGKNNILYNLQSAVSFFNNDTLLINFDENITSEIIFDTSSSYIFRKKDTSGLAAGAIIAIILVLLIVVAVTLGLFFRNKLLWRHRINSTKIKNYQPLISLIYLLLLLSNFIIINLVINLT